MKKQSIANKQVYTAALRTRTYAGKPQALEMGESDAVNAITSVAKDSLIVEQQVLGWTRDKQDNVVDRHPVDMVNCVTTAKRDNTQNYVKEYQKVIASTQRHAYRGSVDGISPTVTAACGMGGGQTPMVTEQHFVKEQTSQVRIRKLTERELFRLQDVDDSDIDILLNAGISNTQLAKLAGNSIVVNVLYHIFRTMFVETEREVESGEQLKLF